jgi:predicted RecA/RadA family phage recombinase
MSKAVHVQKGEILDYTNPGETTIGYLDIVPFATQIGVALEEIAPGATGSVSMEGVYEASSVNDAAFVAGDLLYWDAAASKLTKTAEANTPAGVAFGAKALAGAVALVKIG